MGEFYALESILRENDYDSIANIIRKLYIDDKDLSSRKRTVLTVRLEKKLNKLLLSLYNPETRKSLLYYDEFIEKIVSKIEKNSGWFLTDRYGFMLITNFKNSNDYEEASHDTFEVELTENGYVPSTKEETCDYDTYIKIGEEEFIRQNYEDLDQLQFTLSLKNKMLLDFVFLENSNNDLLASCIIDYLGYRTPELKKEKTI